MVLVRKDAQWTLDRNSWQCEVEHMLLSHMGDKEAIDGSKFLVIQRANVLECLYSSLDRHQVVSADRVS